MWETFFLHIFVPPIGSSQHHRRARKLFRSGRLHKRKHGSVTNPYRFGSNNGTSGSEEVFESSIESLEQQPVSSTAFRMRSACFFPFFSVSWFTFTFFPQVAIHAQPSPSKGKASSENLKCRLFALHYEKHCEQEKNGKQKKETTFFHLLFRRVAVLSTPRHHPVLSCLTLEVIPRDTRPPLPPLTLQQVSPDLH